MPTLFGVECSADVFEANQHLLKAAKEPKTPARKDLDAEIRQRFARQFEATWQLCNGPALETEFRFCPERDWRADYRHGLWLIELEGGVYMSHGGGHRSKSGYIDDIFKYNAASTLGYRVVRIATGMVNADYLRQIIAAITTTINS